MIYSYSHCFYLWVRGLAIYGYPSSRCTRLSTGEATASRTLDHHAQAPRTGKEGTVEPVMMDSGKGASSSLNVGVAWVHGPGDTEKCYDA